MTLEEDRSPWDPRAMPGFKEAIEKFPGLKRAFDTGHESDDVREITFVRWIYNHPDLSSLRGNPQAILDAMDYYAGQEYFLINVGKDKGGKLADVIERERPSVYVELGGYVGSSAILAAATMKRVGTADGRVPKVWSLEFDPVNASIAMNMVELAGLSDVVTVVVGKADESAERLKKEGKLDKVDLLLIDHVEERYVPDFEKFEALGLFREGSVIVADNILRPGCPQYKAFAQKHPKLESKTIKGLIQPGDLEDEMEISKFKTI